MPFQAGQRVAEPVSFIDLSPTFLSLAGLEIPAQIGWTAYQAAWQAGELSGIHAALWQPPAIPEQLYDLAADPWEINNLAADPPHAGKLAALRDRLKKTMLEVHDTSLIPEPMFKSLAEKATIAGYAQSTDFDIQKIAALAFTTSAGDLTKTSQLKEAIISNDPVERYWGALGFRVLGAQ